MMHKSGPSRVLWRGLAAPLALGGLLGGLAAGLGPATMASAATCQVPGSPQPVSPASNNNEPHSVAVISSCDAWLVGFDLDAKANHGANHVLSEHFDGTAWKEVPVPTGTLGTLGSELNGVSAVSGHSVYAVGEFADPNRATPVVEHWNGTVWTPQTQLGVGDAELDSVRAISDSDIWVTGSSFNLNGSSRQPLILHFDGRTWTRTPVPPVGGPGDDIRVLSVAASSPGNVWAVGDDFTGRDRPFILHWTGSRWEQSGFAPLPGDADLASVTTTSPFDAWAVGSAGDTPSQTLTMHWNGEGWVRVPSPDPGSDAGLSGVTATSRTSVFAVGADTAGNDAVDTLVLRWDGHHWTQVTTPNPANLNRLNAVAADAPSDVWAVGTAEGASVPVRAFAVPGF